MHSINRKSVEPLYRQAAQILREQITSGLYEVGGRLPSIRELSKHMGLNHVTIRQAISQLADEGLLVSEHGRGTYVLEGRAASSKLEGISIVLPSLEFSLCEAISRGVSMTVRDRDISVAVKDYETNPIIEAEYLEYFMTRKNQGAILYSSLEPQAIFSVIKTIFQETPLVLIDRYIQDVPTWHATSDNVQGGYDITRHLIERGYKRIVFAYDVDVTSVRLRMEGYRRAMEESDLRTKSYILNSPGYPSKLPCDTTRKLMQNGPIPEAIVYANDLRALMGLREIKAMGFKVPGDIAVTGFDDTPMAALSDPPLTTMRQNALEVGKAAAELLLEQAAMAPAQRKHNPKTRTVPMELVVRQST